MEKIKVGVIGGSGVYELSGVKVKEELEIDTPFGKPSDKITIGEVNNRKVAFLPRHGKGHRYLPTEVPSQANIYAMKVLGVDKIIAVSAVGSLKEEIRPTDLVLPKQIIDRTKQRALSFFGNGIVGHVSFADPFCEETRSQVRDIIMEYLGKNTPDKRLFSEETYLCMEGPQFSSRAESHLYRSWGAGVIGMTAIPEAKLAREAEICYVMIAMSTDYDCWREEEEAVGVSMVMENMKENNKTVNQLLPLILEKLTLEQSCDCAHASQYAIMTNKAVIPERIKKDLDVLFGRYF